MKRIILGMLLGAVTLSANADLGIKGSVDAKRQGEVGITRNARCNIASVDFPTPVTVTEGGRHVSTWEMESRYLSIDGQVTVKADDLQVLSGSSLGKEDLLNVHVYALSGAVDEDLKHYFVEDVWALDSPFEFDDLRFTVKVTVTFKNVAEMEYVSGGIDLEVKLHLGCNP